MQLATAPTSAGGGGDDVSFQVSAIIRSHSKLVFSDKTNNSGKAERFLPSEAEFGTQSLYCGGLSEGQGVDVIAQASDLKGRVWVSVRGHVTPVWLVLMVCDDVAPGGGCERSGQSIRVGV